VQIDLRRPWWPSTEVEEGQRHEGEDHEDEEPEQATVWKEEADLCEEEACARCLAAGKRGRCWRPRSPLILSPSPLLRLHQTKERTEETKGSGSTRTSSPASAMQQLQLRVAFASDVVGGVAPIL
jgi:hypothetical protein